MINLLIGVFDKIIIEIYSCLNLIPSPSLGVSVGWIGWVWVPSQLGIQRVKRYFMINLLIGVLDKSP